MTIEQLNYFMEIAKYKNFSVAAEASYISQSSLSKQIKALEVELGNVELFSRNKKRLEITEAGKEFYISAEKILMEYQKMMNKMHEYSGERIEFLNVGTIPVMNHYGLTDVFFDFQQYYTNIRLNFLETNSYPIVEAYEKGKIDIVFLRENFLPSGDFDVYPLVDDELVLVVGVNHWLAQYDEVDLKIAEGERFLLLGNNSGMVESCRKACTKAGFTPKERVMDVRSSTLKNMVANGKEVTLMMYKSIKFMDDPKVKIIQLKRPYKINLCLIVRRGINSDAASAFVEYVRDSFGHLEAESISDKTQ